MIKTGRSNINPAADTRWFIEKGNRTYRLKVGGVYFSGSGDQFRITAYEIHYDHTTEVQVIDAETFLKHIDEGRVKPDYNEKGSLVH